MELICRIHGEKPIAMFERFLNIERIEQRKARNVIDVKKIQQRFCFRQRKAYKNVTEHDHQPEPKNELKQIMMNNIKEEQCPPRETEKLIQKSVFDSIIVALPKPDAVRQTNYNSKERPLNFSFLKTEPFSQKGILLLENLTEDR